VTHVLAEAEGAITIADAVLQQVVVQSVESVDGARVRRARRHLEIELDGSRARVEIELSAHYGAVLPELARGVQSCVSEALERICGLDVDAVDVTVAELEGA
jgi:uncharacterized alkaline shock family protein YloU